MNWIKDTYETLENTTAPGVITGKALDSGGSEGRVEATGRSVALSAREAFDWLDRDIAGATVAVQGYGNAGSIAAALLADLAPTWSRSPTPPVASMPPTGSTPGP